MKFKIGVYTVMFVCLFYFSLFIAGLLPFLSKVKLDLTLSEMGDYSLNILFHPIENIKIMSAENNPMLYISMGAALILFVYTIYKSRNKGYENVGERYGVQGSSRWAKKQEIFNVPDQITVIPSKDLYGELRKTLKEAESEQWQEVKK